MSVLISTVPVYARHARLRTCWLRLEPFRSFQANPRFYVLEGEFPIYVGDTRLSVPAGSFAFGPRGVPHTFIAAYSTFRVGTRR
jgi:mannose-6-phosphate isomerase-like protein (cupin superfamily)